MLTYEYATIEDFAGRTVKGTVLRYGESTKDYRAHIYEPDSLAILPDLSLNRMHNKSLEIVKPSIDEIADTISIAATLPDNQIGNQAIEDIKSGKLTGFSGEVWINERNANRISDGLLTGVALVDNPAFPSSKVEALYTAEIYVDDEGIEGEFAYDVDSIISATGKTRKQRVAPKAFDYAIRAKDREINLQLGDTSRQLASKLAGSLRIEDTPKAMRFRVDKLPRTSYVSDFLQLLRAKSITPGVLPIFEPTPRSVASRLFSDGRGAVIEEPEEQGSSIFRRVIRSALLTGIRILFRPPRGNPGSVTTLPTRLRRPLTSTAVVGGIRPISGDVVRNGRVFRNGVDIGPVAASLRRRFA